MKDLSEARLTNHRPVDLAAVDELLTREAGDVIRSELHEARGIARADVLDALDADGALGHERAK